MVCGRYTDREMLDATNLRYRHCHYQGELLLPVPAVHNANSEPLCITPSPTQFVHLYMKTQSIWPPSSR